MSNQSTNDTTPIIESVENSQVEETQISEVPRISEAPQVSQSPNVVSDHNIDKPKYEVVFFARYNKGQRPSVDEITTHFSNYGVVHHVKCPESRNCAFIFMSSLSTTAENRRTRTTIRQIIHDMTRENQFHISVADGRRPRVNFEQNNVKNNSGQVRFQNKNPQYNYYNPRSRNNPTRPNYNYYNSTQNNGYQNVNSMRGYQQNQYQNQNQYQGQNNIPFIRNYNQKNFRPRTFDRQLNVPKFNSNNNFDNSSCHFQTGKWMKYTRPLLNHTHDSTGKVIPIDRNWRVKKNINSNNNLNNNVVNDKSENNQ
ncbi:hypothetical protein CE11_00664 [Megavirus courdo11]|uniref:RRM domain-containing protein n=2 Tax=Megavirus TaxID=3044761 RepID=K7Y9L4_9VIRU|nr:hypothetical protein c7_L733 [Megavirus courdo7]AFX92690.1 hypothetical protein CE11_00664 [Megavirus courdo11]AVL93931.1 hypothetical protein mvi_571 [Megavirus vitis]